jgi:hypothetical protein
LQDKRWANIAPPTRQLAQDNPLSLPAMSALFGLQPELLFTRCDGHNELSIINSSEFIDYQSSAIKHLTFRLKRQRRNNFPNMRQLLG